MTLTTTTTLLLLVWPLVLSLVLGIPLTIYSMRMRMRFSDYQRVITEWMMFTLWIAHGLLLALWILCLYLGTTYKADLGMALAFLFTVVHAIVTVVIACCVSDRFNNSVREPNNLKRHRTGA